MPLTQYIYPKPLQVTKYYEEGQFEEAEAASSKALKANKVGVVLGVILSMVMIPSLVLLFLWRLELI